MADSYYYHQQLRARQQAQEQAAREAQRAASRQTASSGGFGWGSGGVDYGGFERQNRAEQAGQNAAMANTSANASYMQEQAASRDREMRLAEEEQRLKYEQMARETNAKYGAMGGIGSALTAPAIGGPQVGVPNINLYGSNGARIGGSSGPTRQGFFQNLT
jgi:hypothetical protein